MARIIKRGTKEMVEKTITYDVWEIKCGRCGCVFEAEPKEFHSQCGLETIICPQCGYDLDGYRWEYSKKKEKNKKIKVWE